MRDGTSARLGLEGTHSNQLRALMAASAKCKAFEMSAMSSFRAYPCTAADKAEVLSQMKKQRQQQLTSISLLLLKLLPLPLFESQTQLEVTDCEFEILPREILPRQHRIVSQNTSSRKFWAISFKGATLSSRNGTLHPYILIPFFQRRPQRDFCLNVRTIDAPAG